MPSNERQRGLSHSTPSRGTPDPTPSTPTPSRSSSFGLQGELTNRLLPNDRTPNRDETRASAALGESIAGILEREGVGESGLARVRASVLLACEEEKRTLVCGELMTSLGRHSSDWKFASDTLKGSPKQSVPQQYAVPLLRCLQDAAQGLLTVERAQAAESPSKLSMFVWSATGLKGLPLEMGELRAIMHERSQRLVAAAVHQAKTDPKIENPDLSRIPKELLDVVFFGDKVTRESPIRSLFSKVLRGGIAGNLCHMTGRDRSVPEDIDRFRQTLDPLREELEVQAAAQVGYEEANPNHPSALALHHREQLLRGSPDEVLRFSKLPEPQASEVEDSPTQRASSIILSKCEFLSSYERIRFLELVSRALSEE